MFLCVRASVNLFCTSSRFRSARLCLSQMFASHKRAELLQVVDDAPSECRFHAERIRSRHRVIPGHQSPIPVAFATPRGTPPMVLDTNLLQSSTPFEQKLSVAVQLQPVKVEYFEWFQASSLNQVSSFIIFFTRASWASTVALSTIALFLITCRIECVTTFAQAFRRSDQTARCALQRTSLFAG